MEELVLTFDIGTQSMRGMLVNKTGDIEAFEQIIYAEPYYSKNKDWAEQEPDFYYRTLCKIAKSLKKKNAEKFKRIAAITTTAFRDSTICLDENNKPLRDMILWLDKREIDSDELPIPKLKKVLFALAGIADMTSKQHNQSVCNYIMAREPEIWGKTAKYVVLSTYMNYKLTGNLIDCTANQIAHIPFSYKKGCWSSNADLSRCLYNVPNEKLCTLCQPGDKIGEISEDCAKESGIPSGIPVIVTGSDKGCETIGLSVTSKNKAAISFGTSATIQFTTPDYFEPQSFCPAYPSPVKGLYNPEYQVYRGYWMLTWFKNFFISDAEKNEIKKQKMSVEEYFNTFLPKIPAGCDGLLLEPHWSPGVANPNAKGAIIGFRDVTSKQHVYRAIIEGINYELMYGLETMSKRGNQTIKEIYVGGGGSKSDEICQISADMLGIPFKRIQTHEACGLGSSIIAYVSLGIYSDIEEATRHMVRIKDVFYPDMAKHEFYEKMYQNIYRKMTRCLTPLYIKTSNILKGE